VKEKRYKVRKIEEALKEKISLRTICAELGIHHNYYKTWKKQLEEAVDVKISGDCSKIHRGKKGLLHTAWMQKRHDNQPYPSF
jgi:transposase-like protein